MSNSDYLKRIGEVNKLDNLSYEVSIGKNIKAVRERKKLSQKELEMKSGITNTQISAYENGKKEPGLHTLATIASALEVTIDELYWGDINVAFINSAPDEGRQIVNCFSKLRELKVIDMEPQSYRLELKRYWGAIKRLLESLKEFDALRDTYSNPESYLEMIKESSAEQINQEIAVREKAKRNKPIKKAP